MADNDLAAFLRELKLEKYLPALRQNDVTDLEGRSRTFSATTISSRRSASAKAR